MDCKRHVKWRRTNKSPKGKPVGRQSVAAARKSSGGSNRTQLIIGVIAIAVILVIVIPVW